MPAGSLENRTVKAEDPQLPRMRRKRRKAYKKWKILNATVCGPQSAHQACQNNIKDLEKEVKEDTSEAVFHQTEALGKSKKNGDKRASASVNGKQDSPLLPKDKKQPPSYSKISREKESNDSASSISHQLEKVLPVVMFNDCEESLSGKVTLKDFPNTVEAFKSAKGKIITEVKCGVFNVQVEIKNRFFCETGMQFPTKKRCPKCHQHYSVRHIQRTYTSRSGSSTSKNILIEELKLEAPSKSEGEIARTESPSLKVSIVGKGIKVKYMSKRQNILINITYPKIRRKIAKHRNISTSHSTKACSKSSAHSDTRPPEKWQFENKHQSSDCWHAVKKNFDKVVISLCSTPEREKNKPHTLSSALDNNKVESAISQRKFKISQNTPEKKHFCETEILLRNVLISHDTLKTTSLSDTYVSKIPFEDAKDVDRERKIIFDTVENITSESDIRRSPEGINYLPSTITDIFPVQDGKGSDFCPSSSLSMQLVEEKAANTYCKGSKIPPADGCENSHSLSFPSSQNAPKSSTPFSPSHWATAHSEPKETPGDTLFFNQCAEFLKDYEEEHVDMTDRDFNKVIPHGDSRMKAQQLLATKSAQWVPLSPVPSSSLAASSPLSSSNRSTVERGQTKSRESHPETAASSRTKAPVTTSITDELEQRLIIQNEKEGSVYSNHPIGMKNPKESPSSLGYIENDKSQMMSVVKNACHREFEDLPNENRDEFCFQTDFPNTGEFSCSMCATDNVFLIDKTLTNDADQYGKQDATNLGLTSFKQEPTECQRIASTKPNDGGDRTDPEAAHDHQVDILLSPQKQTALKDWNLEINSLHKLSEELAPRGTRVSDGSQEEATDQWARRRQQFKDGKRCSSAGGSSFASSITEGSVTSEDGCSVDLGFRVNLEGRGFYTENFHSAAWIFQGDDGNPEYSPRCLSKKPRPVAVRERTVRLIKGTGDYPWGFRIQFSKPIVVTEVDANSAAEEAGLQIGDRVLAINGTEVTSAEHVDAVHLARKGPDILTLVVGSDISRCPSSPWPTCRGYLHKRTHSGFVKGWRKRWFVLKHDSCLCYYRHKKDEGKCPPLEVIKLEGAEVGIDSSLGKPFVFNCVPQSGNRAFCLCATSNQEMKRWLEAMGKATHPVRQNHVWEDVTLHNSSLPPLAIKSPECLGLLHRLDCSTDMWVQHYCILKDGCLYFYASIRSTQASDGHFCSSKGL
ncbi:NAD-capped RNA hydrolase NUDT12 isoform X3 [Manis javanica]|uniref:NAD-capped RNA hydrolase NUDT12 isoform X3 n=1 Tax=Manis javanica TaxID=9974 RepID=UPI003C6D6460